MTMKRAGQIVLFFFFAAVVLTACKTANTMPVDDAYYRAEAAPAPALPVYAGEEEEYTETPAPTIEYTTVKDTVVTIRVHR